MSSLRDSRPPDPTPSPERLDWTPLVDPVARTAEMPMPGGQDQMDLIKICQEDSSLYPMCLELQSLADGLENNPSIIDHEFIVSETVKALRKGKGWPMYELLHSMPHQIIQSIVQGTVAFDHFSDDTNWLPTPEADDGKVPGVYVIGLSRVDKRGWFLNIKEMKKLIKGIKRYISGYKTISKHISSVNDGAVSFGNLAAFSIQERDDVQFVALVDGDANKFQPGHSTVLPKWVTKDEELPRFDALLRTYEEMCHEDLDPTGLVRMRQSPLYVGCSKDLQKRMKTYGQPSLPKVNRHLALTIKVLAQLSLSVDVHVRPVLLIWKKDQLPVAEQLVATIAGSLIYQYGFNAIETGGTGSKTVDSKVSLTSNARLIMSFLNDMRMNVRETLEKLQSRKQFLGRLSEAQKEAADINETMQACVSQVSGFPNHPKWNRIIDEMNEIAKRMQGRLDERKEALRQWQLLLEIEKMLVSPVGTSHP